MNVAMQATISSFEHLERASGNAMDMSAIELARRELARAEQAFDLIETQICEADQQQDRFNSSIREGTSAANALLSKMMALVGTYMSIQALGNVIQLSDEVTDLKARVQLVVEEMPVLPPQALPIDVSLGGMSDLEMAQQMIFDAAQRSYASVKDTSALVSRIGSNAGDAFGSVAEVVGFAELVQKQFGIAGANATEASNATIQLSQALASGVLRGDELASIFEQAPNLIRSIEDYLGVSTGQIREMASEGQLTAEIVKNAMFAAADDINNRFNSMPTTWSQIWTIFKNEAQRAFGDVLTGINAIANSDRFKAFYNDAIQTLYSIAAVMTEVFSLFVSIGAFVYDNWSLIAPIMGTATAALAAYLGALLILKSVTVVLAVWQGILAIRTAGQAAATYMAAGATLAQTAAQYGLNAALYACPITWIILSIIVFIGVIYLAIGALNYFAGTSISATGVIAGTFMMLDALLHNVIAAWWNLFASLVEFWANVWTEPTYTIKRLFGNLATSALDMATVMIGNFDSAATNLANLFISGANMAIRAINWVIDALNTIPGLELGGVSEFEQRHSLVADYSGLKNNINDWVGEAPAGYWEAPKMEMKNLGAAWDKGYNWGANLFNSENQAGNNLATEWDKIMSNFTAPDLNALGGKGEDSPAAKQTAGNTAKMAKSMDGAVDEMKYLRDMANANAENRYITQQIKVDARSENSINSELDLDGIVGYLVTKTEEAIQTVGEGV